MSQEIATPTAIVPSNQTDKDKIKSAIKEIDVSLVLIDAQRELIKEIADGLNEEYGMSRRLVNSIAKAYHAGNKTEVDQAYEEFIDFYENIIN